MRLPELSAGKSLNSMNNRYEGDFEAPRADGVEMEGFFDSVLGFFGGGGLVGSLMKTFGGSKGKCIADCISSKGISTGLSCITCGTNPGCWAACAGPEVVGCISKCL